MFLTPQVSFLWNLKEIFKNENAFTKFYFDWIFGSSRSPRSQDGCACMRPSVCVCDIMLTSSLEEFLRVLKGLKWGLNRKLTRKLKKRAQERERELKREGSRERESSRKGIQERELKKGSSRESSGESSRESSRKSSRESFRVTLIKHLNGNPKGGRSPVGAC